MNFSPGFVEDAEFLFSTCLKLVKGSEKKPGRAHVTRGYLRALVRRRMKVFKFCGGGGSTRAASAQEKKSLQILAKIFGLLRGGV